jgi:hypothetical protein
VAVRTDGSWPFEIADCRLEIGQACILVRLQDAGTDFGAN